MAEKPDDMYIPSVQQNNKGRSVLIVTTDDVQDLEFFYPYYRLVEEGYQVDVVTPDGGEFRGKNGMGLKDSKSVADINPEQYALLYIPGGKAPAKLKDDKDVLSLVSRFAKTGKPLAAFCHGPQVLAAAKLIGGRRIAAWPDVEGEVKEAGAQYISEPAVVDGQFITGRWPGDLPTFTARVLQVLSEKPGTASTRNAA